MSTHRKIARSAGVIGALTGVSRVLGFIRDLVIAAAFGTGVGAEAFVVSFKLPNLLRDLVGEGAANAAFVPVLTECREKRPQDFGKLVSTLFLILSAVLAVFAVLGVVFAPFIVRLIAPGFAAASDPSKLPLTIELTRVIFPYVLLIGLSALAMGVLNSTGEFTSSAFGPILLNLSMIACGVLLEGTYGPMALVWGVLAGGVLQLGCQVPPLLSRGIRLERPDWNLPAVRRIGKLLVPRALGSALYQINVFVDSILASFESIVGPGAQSALYYSNRLFQLPLAIFGISLAQALLPAFSTQAVRQDVEGFKRTFSMALRGLGLAALPAAVGLGVLARPIVRIIFEHGRFDAASTRITSSALFFYAFGLLSCCFIKVLVNAFYAMQDTRTPVRTMGVSVGLNVALSLMLMGPMGIGGLTLASSVSATFNAALLYRALRRRVGPLGGRRILGSLARVGGASAAMGFCAWIWDVRVLTAHAGAGRLVEGGLLAAGIALSVLAYLVFVFLLKVEEARDLLKWRRSSPKP